MLLAAYGTLRKEGRNHNYIKGAKLITKIKINGFNMYSNGSYPYVTKGENIIIVEIFDVNQDDFERTKRMETGAGYEEIEINIDEYECKMFIINKSSRYPCGKEDFIESGDWIEYISSKNKLYDEDDEEYDEE